VHKGILRGVRGPRGGYRLARERRKISAGEIVELVAGIERSEEQQEPHPASPMGARVINPVVEELQAEMMRRLHLLTIEDFCLRAEKEGLAEPAEPAADFAI
jgi:DNA-binding IscR family transcriptional regulator